MSSREKYNAVFAKQRNRFNIERQARKNAEIADDLSSSIEGKDEKNEDYIYTQITDLFKNRQWLKGFELIEGKENISTKFYMRLLDFLFTYKINDDEDYEACGTARVYFDLCLDKISQNPENVNYLMNIFEENKISDVVLNSIDQNDSGEDCFSLAEYYFVIAKKILATKDFMAGEYVAKILSEWDKKIGKFYKFGKHNNPQNNKLRKKSERLDDFQDELAYYQLAEDVNSEEEEKKYKKSMVEDNDRQRYLIERIEETNLNWDSDYSEQLRGSREKGILLDLINELKDNKPKVIDYLFDFLANDGNASLFLRQISDIINQISPEYAVNKLLHLIKSKNEFLKRDATALLHRLEFGRIGISEEGVHYLEHVYDLGEFNNPAFHVSRLTPNGELGIFNQDLQLIKFIQLGDLSTPEKRTRAQVYDFVYETLFIGQKNETPEERAKRMQYLEEFKQNYYARRAQLEKESGVTLNNLTFKEQGWFIIYFSKAAPQAKEQIHNFAKDFGEEGIKTFLALEGGEQNGQIILDLAQQLDHNVAQAIFMKFTEVVRYINLTGAEISQEYFNNDKIVESAMEIIKRAGQILVNNYEQMLVENYTQKSITEKKEFNDKIMASLHHIKTDTLVFASILKSVYEGKIRINLQELKGVDFISSFSSELNTEDHEQILAIIEKNYQADEAQKQDVLRKVKIAFTNKEKTKWYILRKKDEETGKQIIMSFGRFDEQKDGSLYAASFNTNPEFSGLPLGGAMYQYGMENEAYGRHLTAECQVDKDVSRYYLERGGFVAEDIFVNQNTGLVYFKILRDEINNSKYKSRAGHLPLEKILTLTEEQDFKILTLDLGNDLSIEMIKSFLEKGFVITRFFTDKNNTKQYQCVLEKKITSSTIAESSSVA